MTKIIQMKLEDGGTVFAEVDTQADVKGFALAANNAAGAQVTQTFEQALTHLKPAVEVIRKSLVNLNNPSEIEIEFGIKIVGGIGAVFSSVSTEANFTVKLTWKNEKPV